MLGFDVKDCVKSINHGLCYLSLIIIFILIYWASIDFFPYLTGRYWYSKMPVPICLGVASRVLWLVGASVMSVLIMRLVPDSKYLANEGRKTLQYYLLHTLMFPVCWAICNKLSIAHNLLSALGTSIFLYSGYLLDKRLENCISFGKTHKIIFRAYEKGNNVWNL